MKNTLTIEKALEYQKQHLEQWRNRLNDRCYKALCEEVDRRNAELGEDSCGYDVYRGDSFLNFIYNYKG